MNQSGQPAAIRFNHDAAELLRQCALLLKQQDANPFRVNAYERAAQTLESLPTDAREILAARGIEGLMDLPFIGAGLASAVNEIARTGRLSRLDRLRGATEPEALLRTVPGIGPALARALHAELHIETLEDLEIAAHDGRLERISRIGPRRAAALRATLAALLGRAGVGAQQQFGVGARFSARGRIVGAPWKRPNLVRAELIEHSPYATDGPPGVLKPSFATDLAARPPPQPRKR